MEKHMRILTLCAASLLVACAASAQQTPAPQPQPQAPAQPAARAAVDPIGVYDFTTEVQGSAVKGVITITRNPQGAFTGSITTDVTDAMPVTKVTVDGQKMDVRSGTTDGELV